jgi:O-antigen/teichoic acid export membrane protein/glycosyltransferase involved in cell wall biosynthesis
MPGKPTKVLVLPRDGNPYQELLYGELRRRGVRVRYLAESTPSHTLNLLLLPVELAVRRLAGARVVHLHWVYGFTFPGGRWTRPVARLWFGVVLAVIRMLGLRLVWTAHNVLPHGQVFPDDTAARRVLVSRCDLIIAHTPDALDRLAAIGAAPERAVVIPHGPYPAPPQPPPGQRAGPRTFLFFGRVEPYKGVEDLLAAFTTLPYYPAVRLVVAGSCADRALADRLAAFAARDPRVTLRLGRVADAEVAGLFAAADVAVLPYREITTSGSALLALGHGRPLIVPDLPSLAGLPAEAVTRYEPGVPGLTAALRAAAETHPATLQMMSAAALAHVQAIAWPDIAHATHNAYLTLSTGRRQEPGDTQAAPEQASAPEPQNGPVPAETRPPANAEGRADREGTEGTDGADGRDGAEGQGRVVARGSRRGVRGWVRAMFRNVLVRGSFLLLANTMLLAAGGFAFFTLAARHYPVEAVGWLSGVTASVNLLSTVAALGLPTTLLRHLTGTGDPRGLVRAAVLAVGGVGGGLALVALFALAPLLPGGPQLATEPGTVALVTVLVMVTAVGGTLDAGLVATRGTGALLVKNLLGTVLKIATLLPFVPLGVDGLVLSYGGGTVLACLLGGAVLWPRLARAVRRERAVALLRRHLPFSAASHLGTALGILPSTVVPLEVLTIRGPEAAAFFAIAFQIAAFLNFIPSASSQVLFAEAQRISLRRYLRKALLGIYGLLVPAAAVIVLGAPYILGVFGASYAANATGTLRVLGLAALVTGGNYLIDTILVSRDRSGAYVFMNGANAALVLALVAVALPHGLTAAALAWTLAQALSLLLGAAVLAASFSTTPTARHRPADAKPTAP